MQSLAPWKEGSLGGTEWVGNSSAENPLGGSGDHHSGHEPAVCPYTERGQQDPALFNKSRTSRLTEVVAISAWHLKTASYKEHGARLFSCVAGEQETTDRLKHEA